MQRIGGPARRAPARGLTRALRSYVMTGSTTDTDEREAVLATARRAKDAAVDLATASRAAKDAALIAMADALVKHSDVIVEANARDVERAKGNGTADGIVDRLTLTPDRIKDIADALRDVADLADPIGEVIRGWTLPNGLEIRQVRVPARRPRHHLRGPPQRDGRRGRPGPQVRQRRAAPRLELGVRLEHGPGPRHAGRAGGERPAAGRRSARPWYVHESVRHLMHRPRPRRRPHPARWRLTHP